MACLEKQTRNEVYWAQFEPVEQSRQEAPKRRLVTTTTVEEAVIKDKRRKILQNGQESRKEQEAERCKIES